MKCRKYDCLSLTFVIKKRISGYKTLIHKFTKRIEDKQMMIKNSNNKGLIIMIIITIIRINREQKQKSLNRQTESKRGDRKKSHCSANK